MEYQECDLNQSFTKTLKGINDEPKHLWYRGNLPIKKPGQKVVAIVGSRRSTSYGENIAYELSYNLAKMGVIIVSGLAYGIDSCVHRACL